MIHERKNLKNANKNKKPAKLVKKIKIDESKYLQAIIGTKYSPRLHKSTER